MWRNMLHPSINHNGWTREEDNLLSQLVKETGDRSWDHIADELNTGRTPLMCLMRFQQKFNSLANKRKWTKEEDGKLLQLIKTVRINDYIPWSKVTKVLVKLLNFTFVGNRPAFCEKSKLSASKLGFNREYFCY